MSGAYLKPAAADHRGRPDPVSVDEILNGAEILIAAADHGFQDRLGQQLEQEGCRIRATVYPGMLARWAREGVGDAAILDTEDAETVPFWLMKQLAALRPGLPIIIFSDDPEKVSRLRQQGVVVWDCLPRPADPAALIPVVSGVLRTARSDPEGPAANEVQGEPMPLLGENAVMRALDELVSQLAHGRLPVLIAGEDGSGRSLVARILHERSSTRGQERLVVLGDQELASCDKAEAVLQCAGRGTLLIDDITHAEPRGAGAGCASGRYFRWRAAFHCHIMCGSAAGGPRGPVAQRSLLPPRRCRAGDSAAAGAYRGHPRLRHVFS